MFGLFKKQKIKVLVVEDATLKVSTINLVKKVYSNTYPKEVLAIHHEFDTAADNLLIEANKIISDASSKDCLKVSRLELLGFKQASQVTELKPLLQQAKLSEEQLKSLNYYQQAYPNNKFITEEQVKTICHKYNLVCGEVSRFKGFVPEKNLKEIEAFKIKDVDALKRRVSISTHHGSRTGIGSIEDDNGESAMRYSSIYKIGEIPFPLRICAPIKDMDIRGLSLEDGYRLEKKHIPDPVVLQPVKNGYLIVPAWGDEASDELVVNQKMN